MTNHDVKAIEYVLKRRLGADQELSKARIYNGKEHNTGAFLICPLLPGSAPMRMVSGSVVFGCAGAGVHTLCLH